MRPVAYEHRSMRQAATSPRMLPRSAAFCGVQYSRSTSSMRNDVIFMVPLLFSLDAHLDSGVEIRKESWCLCLSPCFMTSITLTAFPRGERVGIDDQVSGRIMPATSPSVSGHDVDDEAASGGMRPAADVDDDERDTTPGGITTGRMGRGVGASLVAFTTEAGAGGCGAEETAGRLSDKHSAIMCNVCMPRCVPTASRNVIMAFDPWSLTVL